MWATLISRYWSCPQLPVLVLFLLSGEICCIRVEDSDPIYEHQLTTETLTGSECPLTASSPCTDGASHAEVPSTCGTCSACVSPVRFQKVCAGVFLVCGFKFIWHFLRWDFRDIPFRILQRAQDACWEDIYCQVSLLITYLLLTLLHLLINKKAIILWRLLMSSIKLMTIMGNKILFLYI